ncbi:MAG: peptidoglycan recognition family protein [Betaproteobacteria bacterium]
MLALSGCASPVKTVQGGTIGRIVTVSEWGGTAADESKARTHTVSRITLHHQGEAFVRGRDPAEYLRSLQAWSRAARKWLDIPYHYVVDLDGTVYAGRDIRFAGDTNTEYDPAGHASIEVVGNYEDAEPTQAQLDALVELMTMLATKYRIAPESIRGHKDVSEQTLCPGKNLYRYLENGYFREQVGRNLPSQYAAE